MEKQKTLVPWFQRGDIGGMTYSITNNIVNYLIVIATLSGVLDWPDKIVYGYVIPGMSIGLLCSGVYYAYMGRRLSRKEGRADVTALPSGVSTPAMFVMLYGVIMPLHYALNDAELAWSAAVAACFIGGAVEFLGGFIGPWMKKKLPRAALLGTVAGIGFIWMATQGVFDVFGDPLIGLPILFVAMVGIFGGYLFPKQIPPLVVAIVGGIIYAFCLGRTTVDFSGIGFYIPNPVNGIQHLINGVAVVAPYLTIVIPVEIYNFIETMDNVEAANAAGDNYSVRETQFADGICTMLSAICGGVVPNTVWLGHAGLKKAKAGVGYALVSGLVLGAAGIFGLFTFLSNMVPPAVCAVTFLWCAIVTSGLAEYNAEVTQMIKDAGVMWNGVPAVKSGAIIIGILLGTMTVFIIDKQLHKVAITAVVGYVLACFGFIHSAGLGFNPTSPFAIGYLIVAVLAIILHQGRKSWFEGPDDFDYV